MEINYNAKLEIDTAPGTVTPVLAEIAEGFNNLSSSINEVLHETSYLSDKGWGHTEVLGGKFTITLTGDRIIGDDAQDYIFSDDVMYKFGEARKTSLTITTALNTIKWDVTLANITESGGDAVGASAISVTIHGNGAPTITPITPPVA